METKRFKKGDVIFWEGTLGSVMYELKNGRVGIYTHYGTADERKLAELETGRIFGEMGAIEVYPRSATAVALTDAEADEITTADLQEYFAAQPERILAIMRGMTRRLRELTVDYQELCGRLGEWNAAAEQGKAKGAGLLSAIKGFAANVLGRIEVTDAEDDHFAF